MNLTIKKLTSLKAFVLLLSLLALSCTQETKPVEEITVAKDPELEVIQKTIDELYASIHVEQGTPTDKNVILAFFADDARMGSVKDGQTSLKSASEYFDGWYQMMNERQPDLLNEWEIAGKSQYFGKIAYHTSKYGVHFNTSDSIAEQGIINYQLVKLNGDWKVLSMIWQSAKTDDPVPDNYFEQ